MGRICIPNQMPSLYTISHSQPLAVPFSSFPSSHPLLGSSKHPLYLGASNTEPLSTLDFSLFRKVYEIVHTQDKDPLYLITSRCMRSRSCVYLVVASCLVLE